MGTEGETMQYRVIDADAHTIEPPGMRERYLPAKFQDRAPRLMKDHKGGDAWEFQRGVTPMPIGMVTTAGQRYEEFDWFGHGYNDIRKGCWIVCWIALQKVIAHTSHYDYAFRDGKLYEKILSGVVPATAQTAV